jgi:class 3 adenylate cyclase
MGTDIVRYDIYGENVVIANKMESNGKQDEINVSENTKDLLESTPETNYSFEFNKDIEFKAYDKTLASYFLKSKQF